MHMGEERLSALALMQCHAQGTCPAAVPQRVGRQFCTEVLKEDGSREHL